MASVASFPCQVVTGKAPSSQPRNGAKTINRELKLPRVPCVGEFIQTKSVYVDPVWVVRAVTFRQGESTLVRVSFVKHQ